MLSEETRERVELDSILEWLVVCLPTALSVAGVFVSIKVPPARSRRRWYVGLCLLGVLISALTFWQQYRSRESRNAESESHKTEVLTLKGGIGELKDQLVSIKADNQIEVRRREAAEKQLRAQAAEFTQAQQREVIRREQAERDLQNLVSQVGHNTSKAVISDIKNSPIRVVVNGLPSKDPAAFRKVRESLGEYIHLGATLRDKCRTDPLNTTLEAEANKWYANVLAYLEKTLDKSYHSQFSLQHASSFQPHGVPPERVALWAGIDQRLETLNRFIDQLR